MIIDQLISVKISNQGNYYASLGYNNIKQGSIIEVPWQHLPKNSNKLVKCICDNCKVEFDRSLQLLMKSENHLCYYCAKKEVGNKIKGNQWGFTSNKYGENHPRWNTNKSEFSKYKAEVYRITRTQDITLLEHYDKPRGRCGVEGAYQLDHIISIKFGFDNSIDPDIIGNISNLQFIPWKLNRDKSYK